jgi:Zn finger protein HypA/HybF involved in hydrogenase expression
LQWIDLHVSTIFIKFLWATRFEYKFKKKLALTILKVMATQAYCVKCKTKRDMKNEKQVTMKNGRNATSGICSVCGTKMFKIGGGGTTSTKRAKVAVKQATKKKAKKTLKAKKK